MKKKNKIRIETTNDAHNIAILLLSHSIGTTLVYFIVFSISFLLYLLFLCKLLFEELIYHLQKFLVVWTNFIGFNMISMFFLCFIIHVDKTNNFHVYYTLFPFLSHWFVHHLVPHSLDWFCFFYFTSLFFVDIQTHQTQSRNKHANRMKKVNEEEERQSEYEPEIETEKIWNGIEVKSYILNII